MLQSWVVFASRGTIDDCELVEGLVLTQKVANTGVTRVEKAKIGLIQFCLSAPKTDVSQTVARAKPLALGLGTCKWNNKCFFKMLWCQLYAAVRGKGCWVLKKNYSWYKKENCLNYEKY